MVIRRRAGILAAVAAAATAALLSGCTPDADPAESDAGRTVQLGAPGEEGRELSSDEIAELDQPGYTDADVAFVHGMIMHHEQALVMTSLVEDRTTRDDLPKLAERLDVSQNDEIAQMTQWLEARDEPVSSSGAHHDHGQMPGILTDEQLAELTASSGAAFDRLFLEYMIYHHEGAIAMVDELLSGDGGQESELFQLASHIDGDQRVEISRMKRLLAELP